MSYFDKIKKRYDQQGGPDHFYFSECDLPRGLEDFFYKQIETNPEFDDHYHSGFTQEDWDKIEQWCAIWESPLNRALT